MTMKCVDDFRLRFGKQELVPIVTGGGQGIGRALLAEFDRLARQLPGLEQVVLSVTAGNAHAVRLYEGAGFVRYGLQPRAIKVDGQYHDKALMIRIL